MLRIAGFLAALVLVSPPSAWAASPEIDIMIVSSSTAPGEWTGNWTRLEIADATGALQAAPEPSRVVFEVDDQLFVSMSVGCNRIGSQMMPGEGDAISFTPGMATRMACMGAVGEAEDRLIDAIGKVTRYELRGDDVVFLDAEGQALFLIGR